LSKWAVVERNLRSGRTLKAWKFESFSEAEKFYEKRSEFYQMMGLDRKHALSLPIPKITREEMELFEDILKNPQLLRRVKQHFET